MAGIFVHGIPPEILRRRLLAKARGEPGADDCWLWTGARKPNGYGNINVAGNTMMAHRVSYMVFVGEIPDGHVLCHSCDTPSCFNPKHLEPDTQLVNVRQIHERGRAVMADRAGDKNPMYGRRHTAEARRKIAEHRKPATGERHGRALIDEHTARLIWYTRRGVSRTAMAQYLGVSRDVVANIARGKTWRHVHGSLENANGSAA